MLGNDAVALLVGIHSMIFTGRVAVDGYAKAHGLSISRGPEDQMQIARVKAERNLSLRRDKHCGLIVINPVTGKPPLIQLEAGGDDIEAGFVLLETTRGCKVLCPLITNIGFRRLHLARIRRGFGTLRADVHNSTRERLLVRALLQEFLNPLLGLVVFSLTEMVVADFAIYIDEVMRGPVFIAEGGPDRVVVVERHRISNS